MEMAYLEWPTTRFRCNNRGGEYDNRLFRCILQVSGISFEPESPYLQHEHAKSEHMIQVILTKAQTMLIEAKLPVAVWAEAIMTSAYLHERTPSRLLDHKCPYEMLNKGRKPAIHHLRWFACLACKLMQPPQC